MELSKEANDLLREWLAREVDEQIQVGGGDQPMPTGWTELYLLTVDL